MKSKWTSGSVSGIAIAPSAIDLQATQVDEQFELTRRAGLVEKAKRLEYFTVAWNGFEAAASLVAAVMAGSVALFAFGIDSVIEVASALALIWRLRRDSTPSIRERAERISLRIVGACFLGLSIYILWDAGRSVILLHPPERSILGIAIATSSLIVMPLLARAKRGLAAALASGALLADSKQTDLCTYLSAILLGGLVLNVLFGWWWADPIASAAMVPIIAKEGYRAIRGEHCCGSNCSRTLPPDPL